MTETSDAPSAADITTGESFGDTPVFSITPAALRQVFAVRRNEPDAASLALRIDVTGSNGTDYTYDLSFVGVDERATDDHVQSFVSDDAPGGESDGTGTAGELQVFIPAGSVEKLTGATLDLPSTEGQGGLVIRNPNRPNPLDDVGDLELTGDVPERIQQLLSDAINPSLAAHGGFATLVGVDGSTAYMTMGGGCQGCSLSQATMVQGIAKAVTEAIPEVTEVVDATDHSAGQNPFYS